jgi:hypothetical protein
MVTRTALSRIVANGLVASLVTLGVAASVGCSAKSSTSESISAQEAADSNDAQASNAQDAHFVSMFSENASSVDPTEAATSNAMNAMLWPAGCATRAKDPTTPNAVDVTLKDCSGPFGLVQVSGELIATFSKSASGGLTVQVASNDLTANGHPVTESGTGEITITGTTRTVAWTGVWTRVNAKGETKCRTINGTAQTNVMNREVDASIKDYKVCKNAAGDDLCPSGEVTHTHKLTSRTLTVDFDGSAEATITGPKGGTLDVPLVCPTS